MNVVNIMVGLFLGIFPLCFYLLREKKVYKGRRSFVVAGITTALSFALSILCFYFNKDSVHIPSVLLSCLLTFLLSVFLAKGSVDIKVFLKSTLTLILFFSSSIFQYIPIALFHITESSFTPEVDTYITCFSDTCVALILIFMYYEDLKEGILKAKENFNHFFDSNLKIWMIGFVGMMASNLLIGLLAPSAVAGNENTVQGMIATSPIVMLFTAGLLAPIIEELTFRKALQNVIRNKYIFILTSGVIFGLLHVVFSYQSMIDFLYVLPYASLGVAFAIMVSKSDNILSSIFMHFLHNTAIICLSILTGMIVL